MAKLPTAARSLAVECDLWSILRQWSKFHLVITFHCQVTAIFAKVVFVIPCKLSKMHVTNKQRSVIKFFVVGWRNLQRRLWSRCTKRTLMRNSLNIWRSSVGISPLQRRRNHCIASLCWTTIEHLHGGDAEYSRGHSATRLSHHCSTTCSNPGYFKIVCPYNSVQEIENAESQLAGFLIFWHENRDTAVLRVVTSG